MSKIVRALALTLVLAVTTSAGEAPNSITAAPTPPPAPTETGPDGGEPLLQEPAADGFGETLLNLIGSVLALF